MHASDALETRGLSFRFNNDYGVENINLTIPHQSITGFLGPNGAGKTTTIKCILRLLPSVGEVIVYGEKDPIKQRRNIGAMVESPAFYSHLSAIDNLRLFAQYSQLDPTSKEINEILNQVGLSQRSSDQVGHYSMGMKQRLGIARALLGKPQLLILDEPTNGLDPRGMHDIRALIKQLQKDRGISILLSSHLLSEVEQVCDHVAIIEEGKILTSGNIGELTQGALELEIHHPNKTRLKQILGSISQIQHHHPHEKGAVVRLNEWNASELNRHCSEQGLHLHALIPVKGQLEKLFLQLTSDGDL